MRSLPGPLEAVDVRITQWMARYGVVTLRVALGVIFFWFGVLNFVQHHSMLRSACASGSSSGRISAHVGRIIQGAAYDLRTTPTF